MMKSEVSNELSAALDDLNNQIAQAERYIEDIGAGVLVAVPLGDGASVVFARYEGSWRLLYERADGERTPLASTSMRVRLAVASFVPALADEARRALDRVADVRRAVETLRRMRGVS